jgi:ABC-type polar amino acid transport system ATPase subunit
MVEEKIKQLRLSAQSLKCANDKLVVLNDLSLSVAPGETMAIIGRSGSGKSTLLRCLSLLQNPQSGNAFLDGSQYLESGQPLLPPWQIRKQIIMVFQNYNLFPNMTAMRNITLALEKVAGIAPTEAEKRARTVATKLGIGEVLDRYPDSLSGGQAQRLALARAMVLEPKVLLLDEITSGLDPETIINVVEAIAELRSADLSGSLSIVLVTHLMHFAADFADRIGFIHEGKIHEELPAKSFFQDCQLPETKAFVSAFARSLI